MKYIFQYRTKDNACHSGVIDAASRDSVYEKLRAKGLKPFGVVEAPGVFNKLFGKGKRWIAIAVLGVVAVIAMNAAVDGRRLAAAAAPTVSARHQIYGDPAIMDELEYSGYGKAFDVAGERFLASFAQPGVISVRRPKVEPGELVESLKHEIVFNRDDPREVRELKAIVNGMKVELRDYLTSGDVADYIALLDERQQEEAAMYALFEKELENDKREEVWERKNNELRAMGLRTVPKPRKTADETKRKIL